MLKMVVIAGMVVSIFMFGFVLKLIGTGVNNIDLFAVVT